MATVLQPPFSGDTNSFPSSPTLSASYPDVVRLKSELDFREDLDTKQSFAHADYHRSFAPSVPSTAPSSPYYSHSMGSRDSYFSTPSYSSVDPTEDFGYNEEDDGFPLFENNVPQTAYYERRQRQLDNDSSSSTSTTTASTSANGKSRSHKAQDDHHIEHEPTRHVDYLSHDWEQHEDIWSSWKWITNRRGKVTNWERLENASWRTWTKTKYNLKTISPESLNWMKDCDVTWLYGPLQVNKKKGLLQDGSPPPGQLSKCSSFLSKKPILKKKTPSALLLEKSQNEHTLLQRAGDIIQVQRSSPVPRRSGLRKGGSDFSLPSYHTSSVLNTPTESNVSSDRPPRYPWGTQTPQESKHVFFDEEVRQVQAIESDDDEKVQQPEEEDYSESDEDDDGGLMMAPGRNRSNRSTPRGSFSDNNKTIAPLPSTTLKYRKDTPEPPEIPNGARLWMPSRSLHHSSSQETLKPSKPSHNFLLDDDPEVTDEPWSPPMQKQNYSPYAQEDHEGPSGMRRTPSGMFMPYDENEEEAAMNNTLFGQAVYAVNTFRDIAHVVWNVGWNRGR